MKSRDNKKMEINRIPAKKVPKNVRARAQEARVDSSNAKQRKKISKNEMDTQIKHTKKKKSTQSIVDQEKTAPKKKARRRKELTERNGHARNHNVKNSRNRSASKPTPIRGLLKSIWNIVFYLFLLAIFLGAIAFSFNDDQDKNFFGYRFMTVKTNSMAPNSKHPEFKNGFTAGAMIILDDTPPDNLKAEDIITFYPVVGNTDAFLTHRLKKIENEIDGKKGLYFITQGDANDSEDPPIDKGQYVGRVRFSIPYVGRIVQFMRDNLILVVVLLATVFGFITTIKYYIDLPKNG